ncbi:MAG: flagellar hook-associated protein FlgK [Planctomycetota bacterium]|nr:MAG: flagellar hook-associated protein FlgK [Planctomycetota bacterium]
MQFSIGVSALQASQRALDVSGNNIANANTPGYHRQVVQLSSATPLRLDKLSIGRGVDVTGIQRIVNDNIEDSQVRQAAATGASESHLTVATQLESRIANEKASPGARLETLFNRLEQLSSQLNSSSARKLVVASADQLAREFNSVATDLLRQRDDVDQSINAVVAEINPLTKSIARLNAEIARQTSQGISPNDLLDQRSQAIQQLSQRIGIEMAIKVK